MHTSAFKCMLDSVGMLDARECGTERAESKNINAIGTLSALSVDDDLEILDLLIFHFMLAEVAR